MLDFFGALLGWLGLESAQRSENDSLEEINSTQGDESANLLGIMEPDG